MMSFQKVSVGGVSAIQFFGIFGIILTLQSMPRKCHLTGGAHYSSMVDVPAVYNVILHVWKHLSSVSCQH